MCRVPVTFGGGSWMQKAGRSWLRPAANRPRDSHSRYHSDSIAWGSKLLASEALAGASAGAFLVNFWPCGVIDGSGRRRMVVALVELPVHPGELLADRAADGLADRLAQGFADLVDEPLGADLDDGLQALVERPLDEGVGAHLQVLEHAGLDLQREPVEVGYVVAGRGRRRRRSCRVLRRGREEDLGEHRDGRLVGGRGTDADLAPG